MARFSINTRSCKSQKHNSSDRRLCVQQLEQRLTLSAAPTGVELDTQVELTTTLTGGFVSLVPSDFISFDSYLIHTQGTSEQDQPVSIDFQDGLGRELSVDSPIFLGSGQTNDLRGSRLNGSSDFSEVKRIPLPELFPEEPEAGTVAIAPADPSNNPHLPQLPMESGEGLFETQFAEAKEASESASKSTNLWFLPEEKSSAQSLSRIETQNNEIVPTRGREISFRVASIALPQKVLNSNHAASAHENAKQSADSEDTTTQTGKEVSLANPQESSRPTATQQPTVLEHTSAATSQSKFSFPLSSSGPASAIPSTSQPEHSASGQEVVRAEVAEPVALTQLEENARQHVFADWRSQDLIAMPVILALSAGPLLVRHRRNLDNDIFQMPPEEKQK